MGALSVVVSVICSLPLRKNDIYLSQITLTMQAKCHLSFNEYKKTQFLENTVFLVLMFYNMSLQVLKYQPVVIIIGGFFFLQMCI